MANFTTPGVYIQEISTLPPSVAPVPTSIPVFIGYTETAIIDGIQWPYTSGRPTEAIRITSMLEYRTIFGGANGELFEATLTNNAVDISISNSTDDDRDFRLFYHMQMFFANGGGTCYIVSVGGFGPASTIDADKLVAGIAKAEKIDEITMIVVPEAMSAGVNDADRKAINDTMLAQCNKLKDRFAIMDVLVRNTSIFDDADKFRNVNVGANNLSYGASYYPSFDAALDFVYTDANVTLDASNPNLPADVQDFDNKTLDFVNVGQATVVEIDFTNYTPWPESATDTITINGEEIDLGATADITALQAAIIANPALNASITTELSPTVSPTSIIITTNVSGGSIVITTSDGAVVPAPIADIIVIPVTTGISPNGALYAAIKNAIGEYPVTLYPSATMAGVYANVDTNRGVWKAPANVGVTLVEKLNRNVTDSDQGALNVDATSGKSINAIRNFSGRGILVWGGRTLDGNSNEWRYVNVRRTFLFIEDSCKKASEFVVFEPNDANTWQSVKGTISNFLNTIWRDGGLAGSKPEHAYFVKVGLGETMSAQDILEGRLIVMVGLAVVRPAEFIVLQFEHKLQES